jgi:hypothetical protein
VQYHRGGSIQLTANNGDILVTGNLNTAVTGLTFGGNGGAITLQSDRNITLGGSEIDTSSTRRNGGNVSLTGNVLLANPALTIATTGADS